MFLCKLFHIESTTTACIVLEFVTNLRLDFAIEILCLLEHQENVTVMTASLRWRWSVIMDESGVVWNGIFFQVHRQPMEPLDKINETKN